MITKGFKEDTSLFETHELALVAVLIAWGFPVQKIDNADLKKVSFFFTNTPELIKAVESYWNNTGLVLPKSYFNALREIKSRIYGGY